MSTIGFGVGDSFNPARVERMSRELENTSTTGPVLLFVGLVFAALVAMLSS